MRKRASNGLGGTWIGLIALATVTSLPELITGASAIVMFEVADIAAGDAIGSCMFNLAILALLDVRDPVPLSARVHQGHVLAAAFGIVQLGLAALAVLAGPHSPVLGWVAVHSMIFFVIYALAMRTLIVFERGRAAAVADELAGDHGSHDVTLRVAIGRYLANALLLVAAAAWLPGAAAALARSSGLDQSFVGSLFVATSTSLPEVVVSVAAVRIRAFDMAAANLLGSNLFNIAVLGFDDVLYRRGSLLASVSPAHLITLTAAIVMTAVAVIGLTYRATRKRYALSWDAFGVLAVYVAALALVYRVG